MRQRATAAVLALLLAAPASAAPPPPPPTAPPTHYLLNPVLELEVDVAADGRTAAAMRYTFRESDPTDTVTPTLALRDTAAPAGAQAAGVQVAGAEAAQGTAVCELLDHLKNLTPAELDDLARMLNLPLSNTAATRAMQTSLVIGGAGAAKLGSQLIGLAGQVLNSAAQAGQTIVLRSRMLGPLQVTVGTAAASAVVVVGGTVGAGLVAAAGAALYLAWVIERRKAQVQVTTTLDLPHLLGWRSPNQLVQGTRYGDFSFLYSRLQQQVLEYDTEVIRQGYPALAIPPTATCGAYLCAQALHYITGQQEGWGPPCTWSYLNAGKTCCATIYPVPGTSSNGAYWAYPPDDPQCPCWAMQGVVEDNPPLPVYYMIVP